MAVPHCSLGLGPVRAKAKGYQIPKPPHVSAKQGCAVGCDTLGMEAGGCTSRLRGGAGNGTIVEIEMVNPLIFRNTIHRAKQKRKRDTSFVIRCIVRVRFFNYLTKFYSPFIKLPPPTCRDYHPPTIWGAVEGAEVLPAPGHACMLQHRHT